MSTRYNTGNQIESTDVRDMSDNAKNLDLFSNSPELSFDDRFGVERKTIQGMIAEFDAQILNMGFSRVGTFTAGATLTNPRQTLLWDTANGGDGQEYGWSGAFPKVVPPSSTPASTGGISVGAWMSRFDPGLRIMVRESIRRSYAEAGYNLVSGSFEAGGVLTSSSDVLLHEASGKAYSGAGPFPQTVDAGTSPASGFTDQSGRLTFLGTYASLRAYTGGATRFNCIGRANAFDRAHGVFVLKPSDTTSTDNNGTILVDALGRRWYRQVTGPVMVEWFGDIGAGDAAVDKAAITGALNSGYAEVDFGRYNYKSSGHIIIPSANITMTSDGATFEQLLWGYPFFEIRTPGIKMKGIWDFKYTGPRTTVINSNTLGYPYVTSGDWGAYGCAIWHNYYEGRDLSGFHIDTLKVFGFIGGIWFCSAKSDIMRAYFDTVDFGVFGVVYDDQYIGSIFHTNITASQGHEGHALYSNGTGKDLEVGSVVVRDSPLGCSPVKLHNTKNFHIGSISGSGLGAIAYFRDGATGTIGSINCVCDVNANFTGPGQDPSEYNILVSDPGTDVKVTGGTYIEANQQGVVKKACVQASGAGARIVFEGAFKYINTNSSPQQPHTALMTSGGDIRFLSGVEIDHPNSLCTSIIFNLLGASNFVCSVPPKVTCGAGAEVFLLQNTYNGTGAANNYKLAYDPGLISPGVGPNLIKCTQNTYWGVLFRGTGIAFNSITTATPIVTHTAQANVTQSAATDLQRLRYMSPGQRLTLRNTDGNSNIGHNRAIGLDGNIITHTGADVLRANWKFATFAKLGGADTNVYLVSIA